MWLVGVVIRRYIDILIIIINFPYSTCIRSFLAAASLLFCSFLKCFLGLLYIAHSQGLTNGLSDRDYRVLTISLFYEQSHIVAHSQGLTNGLSDRDYRVLTISLFYEQSHIIAHSQGLTNGLSDRDYRVLTIHYFSLFYVQK